MNLAKDSYVGDHSVVKECAVLFNVKTSISCNSCVWECYYQGVSDRNAVLVVIFIFFPFEFCFLAVCLKQEEGKMKGKEKGSFTLP